MATNTSQTIPGVRENRESSGGEDDSEEILDPRVKVCDSVGCHFCRSQARQVARAENHGKFP